MLVSENLLANMLIISNNLLVHNRKKLKVCIIKVSGLRESVYCLRRICEFLYMNPETFPILSEQKVYRESLTKWLNNRLVKLEPRTRYFSMNRTAQLANISRYKLEQLVAEKKVKHKEVLCNNKKYKVVFTNSNIMSIKRLYAKTHRKAV